MMIYIWVGLCWGIAGIFTALAHSLAFKFKKSIFKDMNQEWWNPAKSWKNVYKDRMPSKGAKFLGSTIFFKFVTDAWHLFRFLATSALTLSVVVVFDHLFELLWWQCLLLFVGLNAIKEIAYYYFFTHYFRDE